MFYFDILWKKKGKVFSKIENLARHLKEKKLFVLCGVLSPSLFLVLKISRGRNRRRETQKLISEEVVVFFRD